MPAAFGRTALPPTGARMLSQDPTGVLGVPDPVAEELREGGNEHTGAVSACSGAVSGTAGSGGPDGQLRS